MAVERFVLGWCDPGTTSGWFTHSVVETSIAKNEDGSTPCAGHWRIETGPRIAAARCDIVRAFLSQEQWKDVEWLLMVDADMRWNTSAVAELFEGMRNEDGQVQHPVIGGLCFGGGHGKIMPTIYRYVNAEVQVVTSWAEREIVPCDATGAAFLLIHRGVLEAMATQYAEPYPWFAEAVVGGKEFGEDWTFCLRVREMGFQVHVATAAKVGHTKAVTLNEDMWRTGQSGLTSIAAPTTTKSLVLAPNRAQRRAKVRA